MNEKLVRDVAARARADRAEADASPPPPLEAEAEARIAARVSAELAARAGRGLAARAAPKRRIPTWAIAGPLAMAAGIALIVAVGRGGAAEIPGYRVATTTADAPLRSGEAHAEAVASIRRGRPFEAVLQPDKPVRGDVAARAFVRRGADIAPWDVSAEVSPEGAVRVTADERAVAALPAGASTLVFFVGPRAAMPSDAEAAARAERGGGSARVVTLAIAVSP